MNGFDSSKRQLVWQAWLKVKANKGSSGVDHRSQFMSLNKTLAKNLVQNLESVCHQVLISLPSARKQFTIPKKQGGFRILGVPTVRTIPLICQTVVKLACYEPMSWNLINFATAMTLTDIDLEISQPLEIRGGGCKEKMLEILIRLLEFDIST